MSTNVQDESVLQSAVNAVSSTVGDVTEATATMASTALNTVKDTAKDTATSFGIIDSPTQDSTTMTTTVVVPAEVVSVQPNPEPLSTFNTGDQTSL